MKRILAYSLACLLSLSLLCTPASAAGIQNGTKHDTDTSSDYHIGYLNAFDVRYLHPNELLTRVEMAFMMYQLLDPDQRPDTLINYQPFTDIPSALDDHCIASLSVIGLLRGYEDGSFRPDNPISRAECVVLLSRLIEVPAGSSTFSDVPETHWASSAISAGTSAGWLSGYPDGTFRPDQNITRLEAVKMINTAFHRTCDVNYVQTTKGFPRFYDVSPEFWGYFDLIEAYVGHNYIVTDDGTEVWTFATLGA